MLPLAPGRSVVFCNGLGGRDVRINERFPSFVCSGCGSFGPSCAPVAHTIADWVSAVGLTVWAVLVAIGTPISELGSIIARALGG
jgi:hypothetical protein